MKRSAAVLSILFVIFWYFNDYIFFLIPAMVLAGAAIGIFGLFTESLGWVAVASGIVIGYDGYLGVGIAVAVLGVILIKVARTHGLLYNIVFASSMNLDFDDEL